jgi:hypothetical protein
MTEKTQPDPAESPDPDGPPQTTEPDGTPVENPSG